MRRIGVAGLLVSLSVAVLGCSGPHGASTHHPKVSVVPANVLLDEPVSIAVSGLSPGTRVTVVARARDVNGASWSSRAVFQVPHSGTISLKHDASQGGSYHGIEGMGLFEYMTPAAGATRSTIFVAPAAGYDVELQVRHDGRVLAATHTKREIDGTNPVTVVQERLATSGIFGIFFKPERTQHRRPAVLLFGGSEGGLAPQLEAKTLAAHGYPTLALAYFKEPGLPQELARIPLEYFAKALRLLASQSDVDPRHILVRGVSRGSEAALLLGAYYPNLVHGVIAGVPSSMVNPGFPDTAQPAWTFHGRPIPRVSLSEYGSPAPQADPQAVIPVEKINGPVLLVCGGQDAIWHSCAYMNAITRRLKAHHFTHPVTALTYPAAGHAVGTMQPYINVAPNGFAHDGGTTMGNEKAMADAHTKLLQFLAQQ